MKFYKVRREVTYFLEATIAAPDEDSAYSQALDLPDGVWEMSEEAPHIEWKPCDVRQVNPWGEESPLPQ